MYYDMHTDYLLCAAVLWSTFICCRLHNPGSARVGAGWFESSLHQCCLYCCQLFQEHSLGLQDTCSPSHIQHHQYSHWNIFMFTTGRKWYATGNVRLNLKSGVDASLLVSGNWWYFRFVKWPSSYCLLWIIYYFLLWNTFPLSVFFNPDSNCSVTEFLISSVQQMNIRRSVLF